VKLPLPRARSPWSAFNLSVERSPSYGVRMRLLVLAFAVASVGCHAKADSVFPDYDADQPFDGPFSCLGFDCHDAGGVPTACPAGVPADKSPCDSSVGEAHCHYDCAAGHGTSYYATCTNSAWRVLGLGTGCPPCTANVPETCDADAGGDAADASDAEGG
jgi:hypothetical protein